MLMLLMADIFADADAILSAAYCDDFRH